MQKYGHTHTRARTHACTAPSRLVEGKVQGEERRGGGRAAHCGLGLSVPCSVLPLLWELHDTSVPPAAWWVAGGTLASHSSGGKCSRAQRAPDHSRLASALFTNLGDTCFPCLPWGCVLWQGAMLPTTPAPLDKPPTGCRKLQGPIHPRPCPWKLCAGHAMPVCLLLPSEWGPMVQPDHGSWGLPVGGRRHTGIV